MKRIRTGRASRLGRRIRCAFCFALCAVFCVVFFLGFYSLADRGENPVGPGTPVSGGGLKKKEASECSLADSSINHRLQPRRRALY